MRLRGPQAADELDASGDVAPLIAATKLHRAAEAVVQLEKVVRLEQQVAELGVGDAIFALDAALHRLLREHVVHGEVLPDVAQERHRAHRGEPVGVINQAGRIRRGAEVEEMLELRANPRDVRLDLLGRLERPLYRLAARVANEAGAAAHDSDGAVPGSLQPRHPSQLYQFLLEGLLLFVLLWLYARRPRKTGQVSAAFLVGYGVFRFIAEFFRQPDDFLGILALGMSMGQWLCLPMIMIGTALWVWAGRKA